MIAIYSNWILKYINYSELISSLGNDYLHSVAVKMTMVLKWLIYNEVL